jgi:antirestriction protein ArdC
VDEKLTTVAAPCASLCCQPRRDQSRHGVAAPAWPPQLRKSIQMEPLMQVTVYVLSTCVPELGAAFLCADLNLTLEVRDDHAAYIASWLELWRAAHNSSNREVSIM